MKNIARQILEKLDSEINYLAGKIFDNMKKNNLIKSNEIKKLEYIKLYISYDFLKSVEIYTKQNDLLKSISSGLSIKGNMLISCVIERDNLVYNLETDCIYAGGYNIQSLHYRYITKTNLPKTGNRTLAETIKMEIKKIDKKTKLLNDINFYQNKISKLEGEVSKDILFTDEDIINQVICTKNETGEPTYIYTDTYEENLEKNPNSKWTKESYLKHQKESVKMHIEHFRYNTDHKKKCIKDYLKNIEKLEQKISSL